VRKVADIKLSPKAIYKGLTWWLSSFTSSQIKGTVSSDMIDRAVLVSLGSIGTGPQIFHRDRSGNNGSE
jgi:hypothetical protein